MKMSEKHIISNDNFVKCEICGKELPSIDNRHLKCHNIKFDKYKEEFPNSPTMTKEKIEKELVYLEKRKIIQNAIRNNTKEVPCYYHPETLLTVNINNAKFSLCDICKKEKKILPWAKQSMKNRLIAIKKKYGDNIENISQVKEVIKKREEKIKEKIIDNPDYYKKIVEKRNKTLEKTLGSDWRDILNFLKKDGMMKKYGVDHNCKIPGFIDKIIELWKNKSKEEKEEIVEKVKKTKLERYNNENYNNIEKIKETNNIRYGGNAPPCDPKVIEKRRKNNLEKFGYEEILSIPEIREKINKTNEENGGWPSSKKEWRDKCQETSLKKYNVTHFMKSEKLKKQFSEREIKKYIPKFYKMLELLNLEFLNDTYFGSHIEYNFKCKKCNTQFSQLWYVVASGYKCPMCYPRNDGTSCGENEVKDFIKNLGFEIKENNRTLINPLELDIIIEDKKICIEYCGLYFHSEEVLKDRKFIRPEFYHLYKLEECNRLGYRLITIFEDEWHFKKEIVMNRLKQILGKSSATRIHARCCNIKEISPKEENEFLEKYHIQGTDSSVVKLGAYYENELVSVMTFSHGNRSKGVRKVKDDIWELNRFCNNYNYYIPEITSKLLSYFKNNYIWSKIFTYADRRWSVGNLYFKLGFYICGKPRLNYWYCKNFKRINRYQLRKTENDSKDMTEKNLRLSEGYSIIWDCGNLKFMMENK